MFYETTETGVPYTPNEHHYDATRTVQDFVYRYYDTLSNCPQDAWRSYTIGAQYTHLDGELNEASLKPAVGQHEIHANIMHQRFTECRFHVRSVQVQRAADGLLLVLVTGDLARGQSAPVLFIQSLLMENVERINQFAIRNAILHVYTRP